jgi:hypothetical protein
VDNEASGFAVCDCPPFAISCVRAPSSTVDSGSCKSAICASSSSLCKFCGTSAGAKIRVIGADRSRQHWKAKARNVRLKREYICGHCPETPRRFGVRARPETPHSATRQTLKPDASFSQGGRWILRHVTVAFSTPLFCKIKAQRRERMHNQAKQANIPAELADNLINSLSGLTAIEGDELRRQVIMLLIDHSYALGYVAGAGAGLMARMRSRLALAGQDIKLALSNIRGRLAMIFLDHGRRNQQIFPL